MCFSDVNHFAKIISGGLSTPLTRKQRRQLQSKRRDRRGNFLADEKALQISALRRRDYFRCGVAPSRLPPMTRLGRAKKCRASDRRDGGESPPKISQLRKSARIFSRRAGRKKQNPPRFRDGFVPSNQSTARPISGPVAVADTGSVTFFVQ